MLKYYSQPHTQQDKFVAEALEGKRNGTFLDLGCNHFQNINNTFFLEKHLNWSGVAIDILCELENEWKENRPNTKFVCGSALELDLLNILKTNNMPPIIDYLSLDLEPPKATFYCLLKVIALPYKFRVVTFETDYYREKKYRDISRELFKDNGYVFVKSSMCHIDDINNEGQQEDFYIYPGL